MSPRHLKKLPAGASICDRLESRLLFTGTWTQLTNFAPGSVATMMLLPDGSVMSTLDGDNPGANWGRLVPDASGSYVNATWSRLGPANYTRLFDASQILQDGRVFVAGGEYGNGASTAETYSPITNAWTKQIPSPSIGSIIDAESMLLSNGNVLVSQVSPSPSGHTAIFSPSTNTWSQGPALAHGNNTDEQSFVKLPDDSILTTDNDNTTSQRYFPSTNTWALDAPVPVHLFDSLTEEGPGLLLPDGRAFFVGATGHTAFYTPSGTTANGTWAAGPNFPLSSGGGTLGPDDAPAAVLRDGTVLYTAGPMGTYNGPTSFFLFNPATNSFTALAGAPVNNSAPFLGRMLALPNGDVLYTSGGSVLYQFDPGTTAIAAAKPAITSVVNNADGSLTLTGTGLNGLNAGAAYGDDAQMDSNYPIVRLTNGSNVYYARTYNWSSTSVKTGAASETTQFTLPLGIPAGTYSLVVAANGTPSDPTTLTISTTSNNNAPTVASGPAASPANVTSGTTTVLSALGADDAGESHLIYTWQTTAVPNGAALPSFSANGTNAAKSTTATFYQAGTYAFKVTMTDAGGLSVSTATVNVVVSQVLKTVTVSPLTASISAGATAAFYAYANDQFGVSMATPPTFAWTATGAGLVGTINSAGLYTAPAGGAINTIKAAVGAISASVTAYTVSNPWTSADVGGVGVTGWAYDVNGTFKVAGAGVDIAGTTDGFHYVYRAMVGDVSITARVVSVPNSSSTAKAGVMIRNSLSSTDAMAAMDVTPGTGTAFQFRTASGGTAVNSAFAGLVAPYWVRLVRTGNTITAFRSADNVTWTPQGSIAIAMGSTAYVGLISCSHSNANLNTATFDSVSVVQPTIATAAVANPSPVNGTTTALSVLGADPAGEGTLTYTWASSSNPSNLTQPTFSGNGDNAAKNVTATFTQPGSFTFTVTVTDAAGMSVTSSVTVSANQTVKAMAIVPANATVAGGSAQQYAVAATDQNGNPIYNPPVNWSVTGDGTITTSGGLFTAGQTAGPFTVTGISQGITATTTVNVVPTIFTGTSGNDVYTVRLNPANTLQVQILVTTPGNSTITYTIALSQLSTLVFQPGQGDDSLTVDCSNGNPIPSGGITYDGGANATSAGDAIYVIGPATGNAYFVYTANVISDGGIYNGNPVITYSNLEKIEFDCVSNYNAINQMAQPGAPVTYNAGPGYEYLYVNGGTYTINSDLVSSGGSLGISDNSNVIFTPPPDGSGLGIRHLANMYLGTNATMTVQTASAHSDRMLLMMSSLGLSQGATFDLGGNDLIIHSGSVDTLTTSLTTGMNTFAWNGVGINSQNAHADITGRLALGIIPNTTDGTNPVYGTFDGQTALSTDILIKYTYYGDATLDGQVDGNDYTRIDAGFATQGTAHPRSGWANGDFNYDGKIDGTDYTLLDASYGAHLSSLPITLPAALPASKPVGAFAVSPSGGSVFSDQPLKSASFDFDAISDRLRKPRHWRI